MLKINFAMYFDPVHRPIEHLLLFMLQQKEVNQAKGFIKSYLPKIANADDRNGFIQLATTVHNADKLLRVNDLTLESIVRCVSTARMKGILTDDGQKYLMNLIQSDMMSNNMKVENEFVKK